MLFSVIFKHWYKYSPLEHFVKKYMNEDVRDQMQVKDAPVTYVFYISFMEEVCFMHELVCPDLLLKKHYQFLRNMDC